VAGYPIQIVSYDPCWPTAYQAEQDRLQKAIGQHVLRFEHMGSTSVPGLDSKPIIDISAAVADLASVPNLFPTLESLGYKPIEQRSADRYDLWNVAGPGHPTHILHFMQDGSDAWVRPIVFRNALRADPKLRAEYSELKRQLADSCKDDIDKYGSGKTEFVHQVLNEMLGKI
jgi:GrpB-like predicted nucleotidyltransferase (UPF0157 family)